jgi:hypothetical protein
MRYLNTLAHVLVQSLTSLAYYRTVIRAPFRFSLKIFLTVWFVITTLNAAIFIPKLYSATQLITARLVSDLPSLYPEGMVLTLKDGRLSTNVREPFFYPLERLASFVQSLQDSVKGLDTDDLTYLFVIDTQAKLDDFDLYRTFALVTQDAVIYYNSEGNLEVIKLSRFGDTTIDSGQVAALIDQVRPYTAYLPLLVAALALVGLYLGTLWFDLVYLLALTLLTWAAAALLRSRLAYSRSYQINLHTYVWYKLIFTVFGWLGISPGFPYLRTLLLGLIHLVILIKLHENKVSGQPDPAVVPDK